MKKIVFIIILGLLWTTIPVEAQRRPGHREQYEYSQGRPRLQYVIGHNAVLFDGKVIKGASPARFKVLRDGYARDLLKCSTTVMLKIPGMYIITEAK